MSDRFLIVVAWLVDDVEIVRRRRDDLGERHVTRAVKMPRSVTWMLNGTQEDLSKAQRFADNDGLGGRAFAFPVGKSDAHLIAEQAMMKEHTAKESR